MQGLGRKAVIDVVWKIDAQPDANQHEELPSWQMRIRRFADLSLAIPCFRMQFCGGLVLFANVRWLLKKISLGLFRGEVGGVTS